MLTHEVVIKYRCDKCGKEVAKTYRISPSCEVPRLHVPEGWTEFMAMHFCGSHKLDVYVDGQNKETCATISAPVGADWEPWA